MDTATVPELEELIADPTFEEDAAAVEQLITECRELEQLLSVTEEHGATRHLRAFVAESTMSAIVGLEAFCAPTTTDEVAMEGIADAIKNTVAKLASRLSEFARGVVTKLKELGAAFKKKIADFRNSIRGKKMDEEQEVKAFPYAKVMAIIAAVVVAVGVIVLLWKKGLPSSKAELDAAKAEATKAAQNIKMPDVEIKPDGTIVRKASEATKGTAKSMGWTSSTVNQAASKAESAAGDIGSRISGFEQEVAAKAKDVQANIDKLAASRGAGSALKESGDAFRSAIKSVSRLSSSSLRSLLKSQGFEASTNISDTELRAAAAWAKVLEKDPTGTQSLSIKSTIREILKGAKASMEGIHIHMSMRGVKIKNTTDGAWFRITMTRALMRNVIVGGITAVALTFLHLRRAYRVVHA